MKSRLTSTVYVLSMPAPFTSPVQSRPPRPRRPPGLLQSSKASGGGASQCETKWAFLHPSPRKVCGGVPRPLILCREMSLLDRQEVGGRGPGRVRTFCKTPQPPSRGLCTKTRRARSLQLLPLGLLALKVTPPFPFLFPQVCLQESILSLNG